MGRFMTTHPHLSTSEPVQKFLKDSIDSYVNRHKKHVPYDIETIDGLADRILSLFNCPICSKLLRITPHEPFLVKYKKLEEGAKVPERQHEGDVGFDLYALYNVDLPPGQTIEVHTGIALEMPQNVYAAINGRSSFNKRGVTTFRGIIDTGYRGEISAIMQNNSHELINIVRWHRFAQLTFHYSLPIKFSVTDGLSDSERGTGGFGSTGL